MSGQFCDLSINTSQIERIDFWTKIIQNTCKHQVTDSSFPQFFFSAITFDRDKLER